MTDAVTFSATQKQRLIELGAEPEGLTRSFESEAERDKAFNGLSKALVKDNKGILDRLRTGARRPGLLRTMARVSEALTAKGFVEVTTPTLLARGRLEKMNLTEGDDLWQQVFWIDRDRCLRPMLAPNLYYLLGRLQRLWPLPVRLFEIGSCFRKESKGGQHLEEFTMLNLVELGCEGDPLQRLRDLAALLMEVLNLPYEMVEESSKVYGQTLDIVSGGMEIASGATGPHPLDGNWHINDSWAGLGIGLERVCMLAEKKSSIHRFGRSLIYLDGARLNIG